MTVTNRLLHHFVPALCGLVVSTAVQAECGTLQQCIAVSIDPLVAPAHGTPLTSAPLAFGNQTLATTSAAKPILVGAVTGPAGTSATLNAITLSGASAAEFAISGGTCTTGSPSLLHNGPTCTILVTFTPTSLGNKSAQINVQTTAITRTIPLTGTGAAVAPAATAASLSVLFNTPATLDLTPFVSGTGLLGVTVTSPPANGIASVSGFSVTYTPNAGYIGPDAFSYASFSGTTTSPAAVVSVTVLSRTDPSKDATVVGLLNAQAQAARRFSRAQITNIQRRMESLHRGSSAAGAAAPGTGPARFAVGAGLFDVPGMKRLSGADGGIQSPHPVAEPGGLRQAALKGPGLGLRSPEFMTTLLGSANSRSANLSYSSDSSSPGLADGTSVWIGGHLHFGTRDRTGDSSSLRFSTDGLTIGMDRRYTDQLFLGVGLGYARDRTDIGSDGSKSRSYGTSIAAYGSYQPTPGIFVDGLVGYGVLNYDTNRYVALVNDFAYGRREGKQLFGSVAAGYEYRRNALLLSPYGRLDFSVDRLDQAMETGAGMNALTYFEQTLESLQFSLGLRAESQHSTNFGWAQPRLRLEYRHDLKNDRQATIAYADPFAGPRYSVSPAGNRRDALVVGLGTDLVFRGGLKMGLDYQTERASRSESSHAIRLWVAQELDSKGTIPHLLSSSNLFPNPVRVEAGYAWDDNLTRARDAADRMSDHFYTLNVTQSAVFPLTLRTRAVVSGFVGGDKLYTYTGLDRVTGGINTELQYRASGEFDAATFGIFGRVAIDDYNSGIRSGYRYSLGLNVRQALTDRIDAFGAVAMNVRNADHVVFDAKDYSIRFNLDYSLGQRGTPYFGGEYRRGDTVSTSRPSVDAVAVAKALVPDGIYGNSQHLSYRFDASTVLWTLGYNRPLGPRDSLDFSWRRARATPIGAPNYALAVAYVGGTPQGNSSYTVNQFSLAYLMRF